MTKRQLIDEIVTLNQTAEPAFLAKFDPGELDEYLRHLRLARTPRMRRGTARHRKYFDNCKTIAFKPAPPEALERFQNDDAHMSWAEDSDTQPTPQTPFTPDLEPYDPASQGEQNTTVDNRAEILFEVVDETTTTDGTALQAKPHHEKTKPSSNASTKLHSVAKMDNFAAKNVIENRDEEDESDTWLY